VPRPAAIDATCVPWPYGSCVRLASLATGGLEEAEKLEQLRALDNGIRIQVWETRHASLRIDTPADILSAIESLRRLALNKPLETSTRL